MRSHIVTTSLLLGNPPPGLSRTTETSVPEEAVKVILEGGVAVLPHERWDLAEQVLVLLGVDESQRTSQLYWARTGKIL